MAYILTAQLDAEDIPHSAFARYRQYLKSVQADFPPNAFALATSDWYFTSSDHRAPHDGWLEEARLVEIALTHDRSERQVDLHVRLLGAYHDGWIELHYQDVTRYILDLHSPRSGTGRGSHQDWRYDEFRLAPGGRVEHEIEWWGSRERGRWLIEAADVTHQWTVISE
jgi:hypothetical protein